MFKILYSQIADSDLQDIFDFIAKDDEERARDYLYKMEKKILHLSDFPNIGHESRYGELAARGIKILVIDDYLVFYTVNVNLSEVNIIRVLHGSANYKNLF